MSIMIREYQGYVIPGIEQKQQEIVSISEGVNDFDPIAPRSLMVDIEGIHVGPTRNYTRYTEQALKSSVPSWTYPYKRPLIMHHNEKDGKTIGRVHSAVYTDKNTLSGTGALMFTVNVPDKEGAEQVEDGRLLTVSIGVIAHDVRCSCCGHNIAEYGECPDHDRGQSYDGEICYWDIYSMEAKELSYVIVPSDIYARNTRIYKAKEATQHISESYTKVGGREKMTLTEAEVQAIQDELAAEKAKVAEVETSLTEAQAKITELETAATETTTELTEAKEKLAAAEATLAEKEQVLATETSLREAAEAQAVELKKSVKQELVENYAALRKVAGKTELTESAIAARTEESLKDAINDLRFELTESVDVSKIKKISDPTISESNKQNVKKDNTARNINLEEGLANLFNGIASKQK